MPRFEQSSVQSCIQASPLEVVRFNYPWINAEVAALPTFLVTLEDETQFRFGSLIGLNKAVERIADSVSPTDSSSAQAVLFRGLPSVLNGQRSSAINKVENSQLPSSTLFTASSNHSRSIGLIFAVQPSELEHEPPTVLRAGISRPTHRSKLLKTMGIKEILRKRETY